MHDLAPDAKLIQNPQPRCSNRSNRSSKSFFEANRTDEKVEWWSKGGHAWQGNWAHLGHVSTYCLKGCLELWHEDEGVLHFLMRV